jgi:hypothetical protein|tara:strand:+ start:171 stop:362 length:192 start_codon:yes stop_codon:yes gene_type:complete
MTKQEQQELIEKLKDDVFDLRQELVVKQERIEYLEQAKIKLKGMVLNLANNFKEQLKEEFKKW